MWVCGGCGKIVGTKEHPYAITKLCGGATAQYGKPQDINAASFISCLECGLTFICCQGCGGQTGAEHELFLHQSDSNVKCSAAGSWDLVHITGTVRPSNKY